MQQATQSGQNRRDQIAMKNKKQTIWKLSRGAQNKDPEGGAQLNFKPDKFLCS